jgi:hypothetical protein
MSTERDLIDQLESLVKGAKEFHSKHGSCRITVGPNAPVAQAQIQRIAGFWIDIEEVSLVSRNGDRTEIDGPLVYFREAEHGGYTAKDVAHAVDWLGASDDIEFHTADWSGVEDGGAIHLEGRVGKSLVDATFVLRDFTIQPDDDGWIEDDDWDEGES